MNDFFDLYKRIGQVFDFDAVIALSHTSRELWARTCDKTDTFQNPRDFLLPRANWRRLVGFGYVVGQQFAEVSLLFYRLVSFEVTLFV